MGDHISTKNVTVETISNEGLLQSSNTSKYCFFDIRGRFKWCYSDDGYFNRTCNQGVITKWQLFGIQGLKLLIITFEH